MPHDGLADGGRDGIARRRFVQLVGGACAASAMGGVASASNGFGGGRLLVGTASGARTADVESAVPAGASVVDRNETLGYLKVEAPRGRDGPGLASLESQLRASSAVEYVEPDSTHYALGAAPDLGAAARSLPVTPDDELFDEQYAPQQVDAPAAWETTRGSDDVTVAVVDQGVMYDHPDLADRFGSNKGKDFVWGLPSPYPLLPWIENHGTHVAGIAAATTDNGTGVAGISDSRLLSCRALSALGTGQTSDIADAVQWAADQGADVINMSLGGGGYTETMKNAVSYATDQGALVICAAGNDGEEGVSYPAAYEETVAVSAVDENEDLADFSQYGDKLDVAAPGVDVLSTWTTEQDEYGGKYNAISGTSMACPAASGVAALGKAAYPDLGPKELRARLEETAVDVGLSEKKQGAGRVGAANIVAGGESDEGEGIDPRVTTGTLDDGEQATFTYTLEGSGPVTVSLSGDRGTDFDLYVSLDGRAPSTVDYDRRSWSFGSDEEITIPASALDGTTRVGIAVHSYSGAGQFTLRVEPGD